MSIRTIGTKETRAYVCKQSVYYSKIKEETVPTHWTFSGVCLYLYGHRYLGDESLSLCHPLVMKMFDGKGRPHGIKVGCLGTNARHGIPWCCQLNSIVDGSSFHSLPQGLPVCGSVNWNWLSPVIHFRLRFLS